MPAEAFLRQLLIFRTRTAVISIRIYGNAATRQEFTPDLNVARLHQLNQVLHDDIDHILVENKLRHAVIGGLRAIDQYQMPTPEIPYKGRRAACR